MQWHFPISNNKLRLLASSPATLVRVEDNKYNKPETTVFNSDEERMYRRRILRTVIDMRNLG